MATIVVMPARAIQELAGHQDVDNAALHAPEPAALDAAMRLLEAAAESRGGIVEASGTWG
jgi:hypothetical protein